MKNKIRFTASMLCILLVLSWVSFAGAAVSEELLYTARLTQQLPMWHYSGGYWIIGSGAGAKRVADKTVDSSGGLQAYLTDHYTEFSFSITLPSKVRQALQEGANVRAAVESRGNAPWTEIFDDETYVVTEGLSTNGDKYSFTLRPRFNLDAQYTYEDFVDGLHNAIPLIHYRFGENLASIFSLSTSGGTKYTAVQTNGWFDEGSPDTVHTPYLHPSMIKDKSGALTDDGVISLNGKNVSTKGLSVGNQTFAQNGATGIMWTWSINVSFYKSTETPDVPENPSSPEGPDQPENPSGPGNPAGPQEPDPDNPVTEDASMNIQANLLLPESCYEGQWVTAEDNSEIWKNDEPLILRTAYTQGLAGHSFYAPGAERGSKTPLNQKLQYNEAGTYVVTLEVESGDQRDSDARAIEVKACPAVSVLVGGCQKENRKQTLTMEIHQNPLYPITSLVLELEDQTSGERVTINRSYPGTAPAPVNTTHIKYRSLADLDGSDDTLFCQLAFLTKFHEDRQMGYRVTATDTRGRQHTAQGTFTVVKDTPPQAVIGLADVFYRERNSNDAVIKASDKGTSAGKYERVWEYADGMDGLFTTAENLESFKDSSMGTGKNISFRKEGVGTFRLRLTVKDLWAEETLEEYVTEADHLQATVEKAALVDNLAPVVSLETRKAQSAQVLLLAASQADKLQLEEKTEELRTLLAAAGVDASIGVDFLRSSSQTSGTVSFGGQIASPFSLTFEDGVHMDYRYMENFWNEGHYTADDDGVYLLDSASYATAEENSYYRKRTAPFYIRALDAATHGEKWKFTIPEAIFSQADDFRSAAFGHDVQSKYLYLTAGNQTLLLDKVSGSMVGMTDIAFGPVSYAAAEWIYTFRGDGIYRVSMTDGSASCIHKGAIYSDPGCLVCLGNIMRFCEKDGAGLWLCAFHPATQQVTRTLLSQAADGSCKGMDTRGYVFVMEGNHLLRAFDQQGQLISNVSLSSNVEASVLSRDASGRVNYILGSYRKKTGTTRKNNIRKYNYVTIHGIFNGYTAESYFRSELNGSYRTYSDVELAVELADGLVAAVEPCQVIYGDGGPAFSFSQYNFYTQSGKTDHRILVSTGVPASAICTTASWTNLMEVYSTYSLNIGLHLRISESQADEKARLLTKWIGCEAEDLADGLGENVFCLEALQGSLTAEELADRILGKIEKTPQPAAMTYKAGEVIDYNIFYSDYEGDPSKESFWTYVHEPERDGRWKDSGKVLNSPVRSFSQNGKYTLTHWQVDSAGRGATTAYDKASEPVTVVFYIESTPSLPPEQPEPPDGPVSEPEERSLTGAVEHTAQWEANRQVFNKKYHGVSGLNVWSALESYKRSASPRLRGVNVFWPGESLQLNASLIGDVRSVSAWAVGTDYRTSLRCIGKDAANGISHYSGVLYDSTMLETFCKDNPRQVTIRFRAEYSDGAALTYDVPTIFDQDIGFYLLHRTM